MPVIEELDDIEDLIILPLTDVNDADYSNNGYVLAVLKSYIFGSTNNTHNNKEQELPIYLLLICRETPINRSIEINQLIKVWLLPYWCLCLAASQLVISSELWCLKINKIVLYCICSSIFKHVEPIS